MGMIWVWVGAALFCLGPDCSCETISGVHVRRVGFMHSFTATAFWVHGEHPLFFVSTGVEPSESLPS